MSRSFVLVLTLALAQFAQAAPKVDPAAKTLIEKSARAYSALKGLSMKIKVTDHTTPDVTGALAFQRPGKARIDLKLEDVGLHGLSDGQYIYREVSANTVEKVPVDKDEEPIDSLFQAIPSGMNYFLSNLAGEFDLITDAEYEWASISKVSDGVLLFEPELKRTEPKMSFKVTFDLKDNLLRRVETHIVSGGKSRSDVSELTEIELNPKFPADTFTFKAAPGVTVKEGQDVATYDLKMKVGALPYELQGKDLEGKTHTWEQYKGKVVLLDFWATWCGPCVEEIPNVLANYEKYHAKGFEVIGVSLDSNKKSLVDFIEQRKIPYPNISEGKGWDSADAKRYLIGAIPFSLLIGKDGKIAAVNVKGDELGEAIQGALKGAG